MPTRVDDTYRLSGTEGRVKSTSAVAGSAYLHARQRRHSTNPRMALMKIATFNINNINRRLENLLAWLDIAKPDVVCLQELKAADREFPTAAIESAGYGAAWCGQPTWNGVAILARDAKPIVTHRTLPGDASDTQSRYLEAAIDGILIACIYAPNGNPQPGPKFDYKLAWLDRLIAHARNLIDTDVPVVLAGDYNVVPTPADIYPTKSWDDDALVQPASRERFKTAGRAGMDRCDPFTAPRSTDVHVLGLQARALGPRRRPPHRPPADQPVAIEPDHGRRCRQGHSRRSRGQRPRPGVGAAKSAAQEKITAS